jgi:hypothetical protein
MRYPPITEKSKKNIYTHTQREREREREREECSRAVQSQ